MYGLCWHVVVLVVAEDLNIKEDTELRFTSIGNEVTEWRAQLRYSEFLLCKSTVDVFNIHGEVLNPELADIAKVLRVRSHWNLRRL